MDIEQVGGQVNADVREPQVRRTPMQHLIGECTERMRFGSARDYIFNFEGVQFISSGAIGVLVEFLQEVEPVRGKIALTGCNDQLLTLFRVTKLDQMFEISGES